MFEELKSIWNNRKKKIPDAETLRVNLLLIEDRLTKIDDDVEEIRHAVEQLKREIVGDGDENDARRQQQQECRPQQRDTTGGSENSQGQAGLVGGISSTFEEFRGA